MRIRRIRADEGARLRTLRLRALADAPTAFGSTLAQIRARPPAYWERLARTAAASDARTIYVAAGDGRWCGIAGGVVEPGRPGRVQLVSMWVDPNRRRSGVGSALVDAVVAWARQRGAARVELWVTETNVAARTLYGRCGFAAAGETQPLPSHPTLRECRMVRRLR